MERTSLWNALEACGYSWKMLYERLGGVIGRGDFKQKYLRAYKPGNGLVWDRVMAALDDMGVDW